MAFAQRGTARSPTRPWWSEVGPPGTTNARRKLLRPRHRAVFAVLGAWVAAAGAGCAGSDGGSGTDQTAAESWAADLCSSVAEWTTTIDQARATLSDPGDISANDIQETFDRVASATSTLVTDLGELGAPDTEAGDEAEQRLTSMSEALEEQSQVIEDSRVQGAESMEQLLSQVSTISRAAATMTAEAKSSVAALRDLDGATELQEAFEDADSCQALRP